MPIQKTTNTEADGSEHFFYAIDIEQLIDPVRFHQHLDASISAIRELKPTDEFDKVRIPGELEFERSQKWFVDGIPMHRKHVERLKALASDLKIDFPL